MKTSSRRSLFRSLAVCVAAAPFVALPGAARAANATPPAPGARAALVFGGSGQLGAEVVRDLVAAGHDVTVFVRPSSDRKRLAGMPVKFVEGDVKVEADVERALKARPYHLVVDALGRSESDVSFFATSGRHIAKWSKATGVRQVILHSSIGVGRSIAVYPQSRLAQMGPVLAAKGAGEDAVIASGVPYTIIRNGVLRDLPAGAEDRAQLLEGEDDFGVVSRRGLGRLTRECVDNPACTNRIFHAVDAGMPMPQR